MLMAIVNKGKVELRKDSGSFVRSIGHGDAVSADVNHDQTLVLITTIKGKVELLKESGSFLRTIGHSDAVEARFQGNDIVVRTQKGKTELWKESGSFIRTL